MEDKDARFIDCCEHCGQPRTEVPEVTESEAADLTAADRAPLYVVRTPEGRVVYVANLN